MTLQDLTECWLQPETHTTQEIINLIILEQFLMDLRGSSQRWLWCHQPKTLEEALWLAEDNVLAEGEGEIPKQDQAGGSMMGTQQNKPVPP